MALAQRSLAAKTASRPSLKVAATSRRSVVVRADGGFIGSTTNIIMVASTGLTLAAGRFGLAPTVKQGTTAGLKLVNRGNSAGIISNDPAGFTVVDTLALGALGHVLGVGITLGLRATGNI
ncbi:Photosystem I reaction center subunit psaK, chloroplastic [Monoraphidium neglectum]|uniref:Photosystem I reaction center subunit psaK, chloroplastic n=1 Tax=Monoraphidium neglectum TaxID=145388 RepID=A0A0D2MSY6_9CHLO|nr:Photosystem I reaction center subunit psaK, chloroplastic [Monoraphidium neglectum]KIZ03547.1 Photosystem I reaction center subunit psaK, chloroplastic [Monoraphidium neglectum]|eukprot:XP_013902566.1 Photosystem I reaction center subunit psaK, chloroplastic [Monoraphidium neglectum]